MQANNRTNDVEGNPDSVDPFYQQGKVACVMFLTLLLLSFLVIGIVTGLNFSKNPQRDESRSLVSDGNTPIPFQYRGPCTDGWFSYNSSCYLLVNAYGTWHLSQSLCHNHEAHLMVVNSKEELEFISRVALKSTNYWIGLIRDKFGKWTWVNGDDYHSTPHFWDEDQPGHVDVESCVYLKGTDMVRSELSERSLRDADCNSKRFYICEHKQKKMV